MAGSRIRLRALAAALAASGWCAGITGAGPLGALENPQPDSFQSGIGLISGWSCTGGSVTALIDGNATPVVLPYGSARADTASVCGAGNVNTGFGLLINYNTLGLGRHSVQLMINGAPFATSQFYVSPLNGEFVSGMTKEYAIADFPTAGKTTNLTWQQSQQNFAIKSVVSSAADSAANSAAVAFAGKAATVQAASTTAALENPQPDSYQSGIGLISGWSCTAGSVTASVDGNTALVLPYGSARVDTASVCGANNTNTGFGLLINYNTLGAGTHAVQIKVNGTPAATTQFMVTVPAGEFLVGASKDVNVPDFPVLGKFTALTWQQSQQNFAIKSVADIPYHEGDEEGAKLFAVYCVCHHDYERPERSSEQIKAAIVTVPDMAAMAFLTADQIDAISRYLYSDWVVYHAQHHF